MLNHRLSARNRGKAGCHYISNTRSLYCKGIAHVYGDAHYLRSLPSDGSQPISLLPSERTGHLDR